MQQEPRKVVGNEFGVVDDEEDIVMCVRDIIACIVYVEISMRSTVSASGNIISSGRESR